MIKISDILQEHGYYNINNRSAEWFKFEREEIFNRCLNLYKEELKKITIHLTDKEFDVIFNASYNKAKKTNLNEIPEYMLDYLKVFVEFKDAIFGG